MKITQRTAVLSALAISSCLAHAQSSVSLYGVVDASVLWQNHASKTGGSVVQMTNGAISNSRWGLTGKEDLGGGLSTIFNLQGGFNPQNGTMSSSNTIFNREAWVGLDGTFGKLTIGRQDTPYNYIDWQYDPLTVGNYNNNSWWFFTDQGWWSNSAFYTKTYGPVSVALDYSLGGVPGSFTSGSKLGGSVWYTAKDFSVLATYQQSKTTGPGTQKLFALGAYYTIGPSTLYAGFQNNVDGTGYTDSVYNVAGAPMGTANVQRKDQGFYAGVSYQLNPFILLREAYYYDNIHDALRTVGNNGMRWTVVSEAEYAFSKSTSVYANVDYSHTSGAGSMELPDGNNQTEVGVGLRHRF